MDKSNIKYLTDLPWVVKSRDEIEIGGVPVMRRDIEGYKKLEGAWMWHVTGAPGYLTDASDWKKMLPLMDACKDSDSWEPGSCPYDEQEKK